ncbi:MAG: pseudouridine synthase, partial [Planctomycetales bacterium]|nr:pseudouridine synthase [Planctomycetales bacterium]
MTAVANLPILNISAYKFVQLDNVAQRRETLLQVCQSLGLRGTILLSSEGINLFLAGSAEAIASFLESLRADPAFADLQTKDSYSQTQPFRRMLVRLKKEIIAFGVDGVAPEEKTSPKLSARELKQWLDEGRSVRLLDTRNIYEYDLGTFAGAEHLNIDHFREFPEAIKQLPTE